MDEEAAIELSLRQWKAVAESLEQSRKSSSALFAEDSDPMGAFRWTPKDPDAAEARVRDVRKSLFGE